MQLKKILVGVAALGATAALAFGGSSVATGLNWQSNPAAGTASVGYLQVDGGQLSGWSVSNLVPLDGDAHCDVNNLKDWVSATKFGGQSESSIKTDAALTFGSITVDNQGSADMDDFYVRYRAESDGQQTKVGAVDLGSLRQNPTIGLGAFEPWDPDAKNRGGGFSVTLSVCLNGDSTGWNASADGDLGVKNGGIGNKVVHFDDMKLHLQSNYSYQSYDHPKN